MRKLTVGLLALLCLGNANDIQVKNAPKAKLEAKDKDADDRDCDKHTCVKHQKRQCKHHCHSHSEKRPWRHNESKVNVGFGIGFGHGPFSIDSWTGYERPYYDYPPPIWARPQCWHGWHHGRPFWW